MDKDAISVKEEILNYEEGSLESEDIDIKEEIIDDAFGNDQHEEVRYFVNMMFFFCKA